MVGEYYVAVVPMTLAAIMHFRVAPLTQQGQGLGRGNASSSSTTDSDGENAGSGSSVDVGGVFDGGGGDGDAGAGAVVSSLDLARYDVLDLPLGVSPQTAAVYLHSSPLSQVCMTAAASAATTAAASSKGSISSTINTPVRNVGGISPSSLSLLHGGIRFHDRFSRHVEELLGDRYLRAMSGQPPEGDGQEEVDDDE